MPCIDPDSPRETGFDTSGIPASLGDTDTDGHFVGYICEEGITWEDRRERDVAVGAGRCYDAFYAWNRTGGVLGSEPDYMAIIRAHNVLPQYEDEAYRDFLELCRLIELCSPPHVANRSSLN